MPMGMGIRLGGGAMGGPAGMPDPGMAAKRIKNQPVRQIHQLAHRAAAIQPARIVNRRDAGAVVTAIFQSAQRIDQLR